MVLSEYITKYGVTKYGDIWQCDNHRVMCGDSLSNQDVVRLTQGRKCGLLHVDPPYGMGKEGVVNDHLPPDKLQLFNQQWFTTILPHLSHNASVYFWGKPDVFWRWWYSQQPTSPKMTFRNEIVWEKGGAGAGGYSHHLKASLSSYPTTTERCLFFMMGGLTNKNDGYWEGYDPIRDYIRGETKRMGWGYKELEQIVGGKSYIKWMNRAQWNPPTEKDYILLQTASNNMAFQRSYTSIRAEYDALRGYFDNTHESMSDVWRYPRVRGDDRHGHPTPKPTLMMERILKTSLSPGGLCMDLFGGSGNMLVAAEGTGHICHTMEINPVYVDTIVGRWQTLTGKQAVKQRVRVR